MVNASVRAEPSESIDAALRRLNKALQRAKAFTEWREHQGFVPRPKIRSTKSAHARSRARKYGRHFE